MRNQLEKRLQDLQANFVEGCQQLEQLQQKEANLRETLLRIGGAIQVLEEELGRGEGTVEEGNPIQDKPDISNMHLVPGVAVKA